MNFHAGSNTTRIPISLKFELNEDFYENFISPLRQERRLSDMITNLLRAYYEDTEIRRLVDCRILGQEEIDALNREIERISLEHSKSVMKTSALKFEADSYFDNEVDFVQEQTETPVATMESLLRMVTGLSQEVKQIKSVVNMNNVTAPSDFDVPDFEAEVAQEINSQRNYFNNTASEEDAAIYDDDDMNINFTTLTQEKANVNKGSDTSEKEPAFTALRPENQAVEPIINKQSEITIVTPVVPVVQTIVTGASGDSNVIKQEEPEVPKRKVPNSFKMLSKTLEG